jgi:hypothetical protein
MTHVGHEYSFHTSVQPRPFAESYISASEDAISGSRSRLLSIEADSGYTFPMDYISSAEEILRLMDEEVVEPIPLLGISSDTSGENAQKSFRFSSGANTRPLDSSYTFSMDYISSVEEIRLMDDEVMEPIPLLGISSDTSSENAQKSLRFSSGANTRPAGTYNDDIPQRLTFPLKSDCSLDGMAIIPADEEDPLKLFKSTLTRECDQGRVFPTTESASEAKDTSVDIMLKFIFDSECSIDLPTEGEAALKLGDQSTGGQRMDGEAYTFRSKPLASEPDLVVRPTVNDVLCGKGGKTVDHNLHYTRLCAQAVDDYVATNKRGWRGKKGVALKVVRTVHLAGGRFLKPSYVGMGWDVMSEENSIDKTAHCIRDVMHRRRKTKHCRLEK